MFKLMPSKKVYYKECFVNGIRKSSSKRISSMLNKLHIDDSIYSIGKCIEGRICVTSAFEGLLVFEYEDGNKNNLVNVVYTDQVVSEIVHRVLRKKR